MPVSRKLGSSGALLAKKPRTWPKTCPEYRIFVFDKQDTADELKFQFSASGNEGRLQTDHPWRHVAASRAVEHRRRPRVLGLGKGLSSRLVEGPPDTHSAPFVGYIMFEARLHPLYIQFYLATPHRQSLCPNHSAAPAWTQFNPNAMVPSNV